MKIRCKKGQSFGRLRIDPEQSRMGQSILEYTLILGAVIAVIVAVLLSQGGIKDKIEDSYNAVGNALENTTNDLTAGIFGP